MLAARLPLVLRLIAAFSVGACLLGAARPEALREQGRRLFVGEAKLAARMVGHTEPLPQDAVRCTNCHLRESDAPDAAASPTQNFGPALGRKGLTQSVARRGGPPSKYDAKAFCRLLREGVDPAFVMIPQTMPRYTMSDPECEALWTFLSTP